MPSLTTLSNEALLAETARLAARERVATAELIAALAELDARRLYLQEGCSSLFTYCTRVLLLSEHAAYGRIEAARAARRFPALLDLLADGSLTLTAVGLLAKHLTPANHEAVLQAARHASTREVERQVAALRPQPDVPSSVRRLPQPATLKSAAVPPAPRLVGSDVPRDSCATPGTAPPVRPAAPPVVRPLTPESYKVQFTIGRATFDRLRRVQDLLRHAVPTGDPAVIFDRALAVLLEQLERRKLAATGRPRGDRAHDARSRHVPASVRRAVWRRDGGRCAFVGTRGRCDERGFLELHHVQPYAAGGEATVDNLELRCRAHNLYEADLFFGGGGTSLVRETRAPFGGDSVRTESLVGSAPFRAVSQRTGNRDIGVPVARGEPHAKHRVHRPQ